MELVDYIEKLIQNGFPKIIVINDGSNADAKPVFDRISSFSKCDIICHAVNMGKGRALKDAFNYYCNPFSYTEIILFRIYYIFYIAAKQEHLCRNITGPDNKSGNRVNRMNR